MGTQEDLEAQMERVHDEVMLMQRNVRKGTVSEDVLYISRRTYEFLIDKYRHIIGDPEKRKIKDAALYEFHTYELKRFMEEP